MGRPTLERGTYGKIRFHDLPDGRVQARALFRDVDGQSRPVTRIGKSNTDAERVLKRALRDRQRVGGGLDIRSDMRITKLAGVWLDVVDASDRAIGTKQQYRKVVKAYLEPELGGVRLDEASVTACDQALTRIKDRHGVAVARSCKAVLSGMLGFAVVRGAMPANPVRDTTRLDGVTKPKRGKPRALTVEQTEQLTDSLRTVKRIVELDVPDVVDWMLATGCRIGEALATRYGLNEEGQPLLDLDAGTWEVNATVIRVTGQGLMIQPRTKTEAGWRIVRLPSYAVDMLRRRDGEERIRGPHGVVFGSVHGPRLRDPAGAAGDLKEALGLIEGDWSWITHHTFRKSVATRMKEAGCTDIEVADQLGHADPNLTRKVYMGRSIASARAAEILDRR